MVGKLTMIQFAKESHPGGSNPIHRVAGRDVTAIFQPIHPPGTIENGLDPSACLGTVDPATLPQVLSKTVAGEKEEGKIDLAEIIGLPDFDVSCQPTITNFHKDYLNSEVEYWLNSAERRIVL